ncbi:NAD(P)H-binding protein [Phytoactinopolyspora halotolerans]|uniref:NAD(P)H-binding protein n=1 Tax=Phytoactinopolyspora halotolerans TaxID=1981512 RepID=A0A6L9S7Y2_9ACTN|nr:NAD(P)H-binding protein [Phytoactinopolyspora halotolerans]NEE00080.1 NAD(P)H-binding protein [Phytoactinopolyspora halotolerans]
MYLVTGATGNVGAEVVRTLLGMGAQVRALVREPGKVIVPAGAEAVSGDLNRPETLRSGLRGVRGMFLLPGYRDMAGVLEEAHKAGVEHVVQLSGRSAATEDMSNAITRYMVNTETALRASDLPWTIVRPSGFMSNTFEWAPTIKAGEVIRAPFADVPVAVIDPADIGAVVAHALVADGHQGRVYSLSGPEPLTPADRARILGEVLGRTLPFEAQPDAEARVEMSAAMPPEYVDAFFDFYVDGNLDESPVLPTVEQVIGRPPRTFEQWATAHAHAFRRS